MLHKGVVTWYFDCNNISSYHIDHCTYTLSINISKVVIQHTPTLSLECIQSFQVVFGERCFTLTLCYSCLYNATKSVSGWNTVYLHQKMITC